MADNSDAINKLEQKVLKLVRERDLNDSEVAALIALLSERKQPVASFYNNTEGDTPDCTVLRLFHPGKGTAYALSYHSQKWIESLSGGEKPHLVGIGHYHKVEQLFYRNVHLFQTGTMELQTPFMRRKNISAHLGGWVIWVNKQKPIGLFGDTHIGNNYFVEEFLNLYYDIALTEGVRDFYHTGDITDGEEMYRGQVYELYAHGLKQQAQEVVNTLPKRRGVKTYFITGNHDLSFKNSAGADIGDVIMMMRRDLVYLGQEEADIRLYDEPIERVKALLVPFY